MKAVISLLLLIPVAVFGQGSFDLSTATAKKTTTEKADTGTGEMSFTSVPKLGLIGIGNLNTQTFNELNSSGKLNGYVRPFRKDNQFLTVNFAFNVNASNTDSLLASTYLFPDAGKTSFYLGVDYSFALSRSKYEAHIVSPFAEFSTKNIKAVKDEEERLFSTLSFTLGGRYQYLLKEDKDDIFLSAATYIQCINVPNEDNKDYRFLFTGDENSPLKSTTLSWGCKFALQLNKFQIFADLKHVLGDETKVPVREIRGFNSNIGVLFNATIFEK